MDDYASEKEAYDRGYDEGYKYGVREILVDYEYMKKEAEYYRDAYYDELKLTRALKLEVEYLRKLQMKNTHE